MQDIRLQCDISPQPTYQSYRGRGNYGGNNGFRSHGGRGCQCRGNWQGGCGGPPQVT